MACDSYVRWPTLCFRFQQYKLCEWTSLSLYVYSEFRDLTVCNTAIRNTANWICFEKLPTFCVVPHRYCQQAKYQVRGTSWSVKTYLCAFPCTRWAQKDSIYSFPLASSPCQFFEVTCIFFASSPFNFESDVLWMCSHFDTMSFRRKTGYHFAKLLWPFVFARDWGESGRTRLGGCLMGPGVPP